MPAPAGEAELAWEGLLTGVPRPRLARISFCLAMLARSSACLCACTQSSYQLCTCSWVDDSMWSTAACSKQQLTASADLTLQPGSGGRESCWWWAGHPLGQMVGRAHQACVWWGRWAWTGAWGRSHAWVWALPSGEECVRWRSGGRAVVLCCGHRYWACQHWEYWDRETVPAVGRHHLPKTRAAERLQQRSRVGKVEHSEKSMHRFFSMNMPNSAAQPGKTIIVGCSASSIAGGACNYFKSFCSLAAIHKSDYMLALQETELKPRNLSNHLQGCFGKTLSGSSRHRKQIWCLHVQSGILVVLEGVRKGGNTEPCW